MLANEPITVYGDGEQTRDFTYIDDIVKANKQLLKTCSADGVAMNIGSGNRISVNDLTHMIKEIIGSRSEIIYTEVQRGDAEHTLANIERAKKLISYEPSVPIKRGVERFISWYIRNNAEI